MVVPNRIENPNAQLPPGPGTLTITEKEYTGGAQGISSTTPVQITGTQQIFALSGTQDVMFIGFASANPNAQLIANVGFGINVDGVDYYGTLSATPNLGGNVEGGLFVSKGLSLGPGNHTVYLFAYRISGLYNAGSIISDASRPTRWEAIFGGGADQPNEPVVGGSGTQYLTIADAILGETETRVAAAVPQAGTVPGSIVGPGTLSAVDDFYKDWFVVNTDTTPSNGMAARQCRVSSYVGATRTLILDGPYDYAAESDFLLVDPVRLTLKQDITENVTVNKAAIMDLGGNRIKGTVDITASEFCWIRGGGYVTNGIQKTDIGYLRCENINISRRNATIYALLLTSGNNIARCEIYGCKINGVVAGRRGYLDWDIQNCTNYGLADGFNNTMYRLVESIAGVAVVMASVTANIIGQFSGAVVYSENSVTGTSYLSVHGDISLTWIPPTGVGVLTTIRPILNIWKCVGAGVINVSHNTTPVSSVSISFGDAFGDGASLLPCPFAFVAANQMTGSITIDATNVFNHGAGTTCGNNGILAAVIDIYGAATTTGNITLTSGTWRFSSTVDNFVGVRIASTYTGAISVTGSVVIRGYVPSYTTFFFSAPMNSGTPTITFSGTQAIEGSSSSSVVGMVTALATAISVGTYTCSGVFQAVSSASSSFIALQSVVSGTATWVVSNTVDLGATSRSSLGSTILIDSTATGGLASITGTRVTATGFSATLVLLINNASNTGGTFTISAAVNIQGFIVLNVCRIISLSVACTATVSGAVLFKDLNVVALSTLISIVAGSTATGPSSVTMDSCTWTAGMTSQSGTTLTWTAATMTLIRCYFGGLVTLVLTAFATLQAWHTTFAGVSSNKCISASGTRPTTYRFWKCNFAARFDDIQPETLDVYDVLPAQAALAQGQPVKINAANQYQVCVAASVVDGVLLAAGAGAASVVIAIRQGRAYVTCKAGTANGDNLVLDVATPTQANLGAAAVVGQEIGTALEAVGAVVAGKCYTSINVR